MGAPRFPKLQDVEWLRREYLEKKRSMRVIGEKVGCSGAAVGAALRRHGVIVAPPTPSGPLDLRPMFSRHVTTPAGGCKCDRPLLGEDDLCCKCGK